MRRGASANHHCPLALPICPRRVGTGVYGSSLPGRLPGEGRRHLGLPAPETSGQDKVRDGELPHLLLSICAGAKDRDVPFVGLIVELGALRIEGRLRPDIDFEDVHIRLEEVGEFPGWSEDRPVGRKGVEREVVGVNGIVKGQRSISSAKSSCLFPLSYRYLKRQLSPTRLYVSITRFGTPRVLSCAAVARPL